jgi:hypothetical protein
MVQGNLIMDWDGTSNLVERVPILNILGIVIGWNSITNYNPPGSPYDVATNQDNDMVDEYPGAINGLVYVSGNLQVTDACVVDGVVIVGGTTSVTRSTALTYSASPTVNPPPGFACGTLMRIIPRTWRRSTR